MASCKSIKSPPVPTCISLLSNRVRSPVNAVVAASSDIVPLASIVNAPEVTLNAFVPADISCVDASKTSSIELIAPTILVLTAVVKAPVAPKPEETVLNLVTKSEKVFVIISCGSCEYSAIIVSLLLCLRVVSSQRHLS